MISTVTDICNLALGRLGARRLASFESDVSTEAKACRLHYEQVRDGLLRRHPWDFATTSKVLSKLTDAPLSEYACAWQMPGDCVRIIRISSGLVNRPIQNFSRRGRALLTDDLSAVELVYVTRAVEIPYWDSLFTDALALKLASAIAGDVCQNPALISEVRSEFESLALPTAQTADAKEANSGEGFGLADMLGTSALVARRRANLRGPSPDSTTIELVESTTTGDLDSIFESEL